MVPIHDSDLAENRWREGEWRQFELWERIEFRLRRQRSWIIFAVAVVFLAILSVPVIRDRIPKWQATHAMRGLAVLANQMKIDAAALGVPIRLTLLTAEEGPVYRLERVGSCEPSGGTAPTLWGEGKLFPKPSTGRSFVVVDAERAGQLGLERITSSFCYDPLSVQAESQMGNLSRAMAIGSARDLTEGRLDRLAFLNFSGLFAEIDFD